MKQHAAQHDEVRYLLKLIRAMRHPPVSAPGDAGLRRMNRALDAMTLQGRGWIRAR